MSGSPKIPAMPAYRPALLAVLALVALLGTAAETAHARRARLPLSVRITAYVNAKPEGFNPQFEWVVSHRRDRVRLYIQRLFVTTGDASPGQVNSAVDPFQVQFQLAGEAAALEQLMTAPAGTRVVIDAFLQMAGARMMMVNSVRVEAEPTSEVAPEPTKAGVPAATP